MLVSLSCVSCLFHVFFLVCLHHLLCYFAKLVKCLSFLSLGVGGGDLKQEVGVGVHTHHGKFGFIDLKMGVGVKSEVSFRMEGRGNRRVR